MTEPTLEQVAKDLLEYAGYTPYYQYVESFKYTWLRPDHKGIVSSKAVLSLDWLAKWCWPKLGEPTESTELLPSGNAMAGQFEAELNWADMSHRSQVGWGSTRAEAAALATWAAIQGLNGRSSSPA